MSISQQRELDAQSDDSMASLSFEDGLAEIDSFFESPPDHRSSNVGVQVSRPEVEDEVMMELGNPAPNKPSLTRQPLDTKPNEEPHRAKEVDQTQDSDEFATLMEDLDQVTEGAPISDANPKTRLDFILNNAATPPVEIVPNASYNPAESDNSVPTVPDTTTVEGLLPADAAVNADFGPREQATAHTETEAPQADEMRIDDVPGSPTETATPSPPSFSEVTLASLIAENLAPTATSQAQVDEDPEPPEQKDQLQDALQGFPSQPSVTLAHEDLPVVTPHLMQTAEEAMPEAEPVLPKSPAMPSSEGKHSLIEEMRSEERDAAGTITSKAQQLEQPKLATDLNSNDDNRVASDQAAASQQILEEANRAQEKARAVVARSLAREAQFSATKNVSAIGETVDEADNIRTSIEDRPTEENDVQDQSQQADATQPLTKPVRTRTRSQSKPVSYAEESSDNDEPGDQDDGDVEATEDEATAMEPLRKLARKSAAQKSSRPATITVHPVRPTRSMRSAPATEPAQLAEPSEKKPAKKTAAYKATKKPTVPKKQDEPVPQARASSRPRLSTVQEEPGSGDAVDEAQPNNDRKPSMPAKRKASIVLVQQAKRTKEEPRRSTRTSGPVVTQPESNIIPEAHPASNAAKTNTTFPPGRRELHLLSQDFFSDKTAKGPRQTRAQQQEEERKQREERAKLPNPGQAAKARHKKYAK